jgi:hypothetical protein
MPDHSLVLLLIIDLLPSFDFLKHLDFDDHHYCTTTTNVIAILTLDLATKCMGPWDERLYTNMVFNDDDNDKQCGTIQRVAVAHKHVNQVNAMLMMICANYHALLMAHTIYICNEKGRVAMAHMA